MTADTGGKSCRRRRASNIYDLEQIMLVNEHGLDCGVIIRTVHGGCQFFAKTMWSIKFLR